MFVAVVCNKNISNIYNLYFGQLDKNKILTFSWFKKYDGALLANKNYQKTEGIKEAKSRKTR
jgi:hypothetical protein